MLNFRFQNLENPIFASANCGTLEFCVVVKYSEIYWNWIKPVIDTVASTLCKMKFRTG